MAESEPLELEHMIGFSADHDSSVQAHPTQPDTMVCYTGCLLIIASTKDPHQQEFLRGHNEEITCMCISPSGNFIATGQVSSTRVPNSEAFVLVWDFRTRQQIYCLNQLNDGVNFSRNRVLNLAFSPDELFLAGSDDQTGTKLCIWDVETGALANISRQKRITYLCWGDVVPSSYKMSKHDAYKLYAGAENKVHKFDVVFDKSSMQYQIEGSTFGMPSSGLSRNYLCAEINRSMMEPGGDTFMVAGSTAGELCVFNTETMVFRACVPVSCGGLLSLAARWTPDGPLVWCGCGDGKLKLLCGQDKDWKMVQEATLSGPVSALSLNCDGTELLAGTKEGDVYVLDARTMQPVSATADCFAPLMSCHTVPIHCMSFAGGSNELFLSGAENGVVRMWDLSHYMVRCHIAVHGAKAAHPLCLVYSDEGLILSGWTDGFIRCHSETGAVVWEMSQAHRGGVTALALSPTYALSGGADGVLRLWSLSQQKLVDQFSEHKGAVSAVLIDNQKQYLVHSCGEDKTVVTTNLKQKRRVATHKVAEGKFTTMTQATHGERELYSGDSTGAVKVWDCDIVEASSMLMTWNAQDEALGKEKRLTHLAFSPPTEFKPAGAFLLCANAAGEVQVWDLACPNEPLAIGLAHSGEVSQASWSPDGRQVVSAGKDCCICVWNFFG